MPTLTVAAHPTAQPRRRLLAPQPTIVASCAAALTILGDWVPSVPTLISYTHISTAASSVQVMAVAIVAARFTPTISWTPHLAASPVIRLAVYGVAVLGFAAGCHVTPAPALSPQDPALPVREYFAALARGDTATAFQLTRSASRWLTGDGLAHGYQPPTRVSIISTTVAPHGNGNLAYVRAKYQLADTPYESTFEVWKTGSSTPQWSITSGATGRLDVISIHTPHIKIANVDVNTPLCGPRISGGTPSAGYFEVPPGVYTITLITGPASEAVRIAVPAMWRDGTPVTATIRAHRARCGTPLHAGNHEWRNSTAALGRTAS